MLNERADKIATSFSQGSRSFLYNGTFEDYEYKSGLDNLDETIAKLKEVKAKSEDSGSKARQYLDGLLKIPFGVYRKEPILSIMDNIKNNIN